VGAKATTPGWPADTDLQELVQRTGDLFIFASTAIQYLGIQGTKSVEGERCVATRTKHEAEAVGKEHQN
jgi:hypothetical protein